MDFALKSDVGKVRKLNEDYCGYYFQEGGAISVFILADGMGGHNAGEVASKAAVESILAYAAGFIERSGAAINEKEIAEFCSEAITKANTDVINLSSRSYEMRGMGTTVVMAALWENGACISHAGDSRAYFITNGSIKQLTEDHSYVEELIKAGTITREEAKNHPQKNLITSAIGADKTIEMDTSIINMSGSDAIILCSDGLTNLVEEDEILDIFLKGAYANEICDALLKEANSRGGHDNITAIVIRN